MDSTGNSLAPIVLFAYNRYHHLRQTVEALQRCNLANESILYVYSDGPRNGDDATGVAEVRRYIDRIRGFKKVIVFTRERNLGLASSIIGGVSDVVQRHGKVIVVEDDIRVAKDFIALMNDALALYQHQANIFSVSGYMVPIQIPAHFTDDTVLIPRASTWGWATWQDRWQKADWTVADYQQLVRNSVLRNNFCLGGGDLFMMLVKQQKGLIDSWGIRWCYTLSKYQAYSLYLVKSKVQNIGHDKTGIHSPSTTRYDVRLNENTVKLPEVPREDEQVLRRFQAFYSPSLLRKLINFVKMNMLLYSQSQG